MDNRTDHTEDLQATAEHPAGRVPGAPLDPNASGLTAGPHNDPPQSQGVTDTSGTWPTHAAKTAASNETSVSEAHSSRIKALTQRVSTHGLPVLIGAAGLGLVLLALQRARRH
jgi:hypothetical protein